MTLLVDRLIIRHSLRRSLLVKDIGKPVRWVHSAPHALFVSNELWFGDWYLSGDTRHILAAYRVAYAREYDVVVAWPPLHLLLRALRWIELRVRSRWPRNGHWLGT